MPWDTSNGADGRDAGGKYENAGRDSERCGRGPLLDAKDVSSVEKWIDSLAIAGTAFECEGAVLESIAPPPVEPADDIPPVDDELDAFSNACDSMRSVSATSSGA